MRSVVFPRVSTLISNHGVRLTGGSAGRHAGGWKGENLLTLNTDVYVILRLLGLSCVFVGFGEGVYGTKKMSASRSLICDNSLKRFASGEGTWDCVFARLEPVAETGLLLQSRAARTGFERVLEKERTHRRS